ncbi:histidine triad nucleotide-binding protein 3 isoform X2 [Heterodontus francisci]|uniref:histidine triad nucleotide-binding protein 3 isoform X2 n=1 Tax=Heterodontus francisci TaxID=7792 RepID=UPI00355C8E9B
MAAMAMEAPATAESPGLGESPVETNAPTPAGGESEAPTPAGGESESEAPTPAGGESESEAPTPAGGESESEAPIAAGAEFEKKCIFCKIGNKEESVDLLHWDEQFACFRDIRPGAPHHYLVVPRKHIGNCKSLKKEHISVVQKMVNIGKNVLQEKGIDDLADVRLGFHWPPFCTITHLHLHVLAPASQMGFISRLVYRINSYWFITTYFLSCHNLPDSVR